ncbi:hypothetical protein M3Y96_00420600 [Aphelenchoides besseyi]|nr:hypothetical protein M3Y96_00420600 [Aphelenchoides besseyi]
MKKKVREDYGVDEHCFWGALPIKYGVLINALVGLLLFILTLVFDVLVFFTSQYKGLHSFAWSPHLAVLLTLLVISMVVHSLICIVSLPQLFEYADAAYLIFLIMNLITLFFHLFIAIVSFALALALLEFIEIEGPNTQNTTPQSDAKTITREDLVVLQFSRSLVYWILVAFQLYSQFVVNRMRKYAKYVQDVAGPRPRKNKIHFAK